jgi:hypothetical protein
MKKWVHILLPLILGGIIYIFFHKPNLALHEYVKTANYYHLFQKNYFFKLLLNYIPDFLWAYSLSYFFNTYLPNSWKWKKPVSILFLISFSECIQLFLPTIFTFDFYDLLISICAALCTFLLSSRDEK